MRRNFPRDGVNLSAGGSIQLFGTLSFVNSNGFSFGIDANSVLTASYSQGVGAAIQSISAGTTQITSGEVVLSNSNGISFGVSGQTITADVPRYSVWENHAWPVQQAISNQFGTSAFDLRFQRIAFARPGTYTHAAAAGNYVGNATAAGGATLFMGIYTMSGSTASLASQGSRAITWNSLTTLSSSCFGGQKFAGRRTCPVSFAVTPGEYLLAMAWSASNSGPGSGADTWQLLGDVMLVNGSLAAADGGLHSNYFGRGNYSTALGTAGLPVSVLMSEIVQTFSTAQVFGIPYVELVGTF